MKFLTLLSCIFFTVCFCTQTPPEIQAQINQLKSERQTIKQEINGLKAEKNSIQPTLDSLRDLKEQVRALEIQRDGGEVEYILECNLSQDRSNYNANMKDWMNAVDFNLTVDRRTYNHYNKGDELLRKGRKGSAMTQGTYSDWLITVTGKHINHL